MFGTAFFINAISIIFECMNLFLVTAAVLLLNIPFGYWRSNVRKFSFQWFMAIHAPVPLVVLLRIYSEIGFAFYTYPILIGAFFFGQRVGANIYQKRKRMERLPLTSCIFVDLFKAS